MDTHINIKALPYAELMELGKLAAEAMELSREYDRSRSRKFCNLIAACNVEMIERRRQAKRLCGTAGSRTQCEWLRRSRVGAVPREPQTMADTGGARRTSVCVTFNGSGRGT